MRRIVLTIAIFITFGAAAAAAQPTPMRVAPAPRAAAMRPAAMPTAMPAVAAMTATAPKPNPKPKASMAAAMEAMKAAPPAMAAMKVSPPAMTATMQAAPAAAVEKPAKPWKDSSFWITVIGAPIISIILGVLVAFGVIKKKWTTDARWTSIMKIVDKSLPALNEWAKGTKNQVDDVIAKVLTMLAARVGELTPDEKKAVADLVKSRNHELDGAQADDTKDTAEDEKPDA